MTELPPPECRAGYTERQVEEIVGADRLDDFFRFMRGQTMTLCEGRAYDHDKKAYRLACGGVAHGAVIYGTDIRRFLAGLPVID